ncbi:MAG: hypothetical protein WC152_06700 [Candidatus Izemoplasmatales bacterium]
MTIEEIITIEFEGLSQTIMQYSNDNFIKSYAKKLLSIEFPKDRNLLTKLVDNLTTWYSSKIEEIKSSDYVVTKESHIKCYKILMNLKEQLYNNN